MQNWTSVLAVKIHDIVSLTFYMCLLLCTFGVTKPVSWECGSRNQGSGKPGNNHLILYAFWPLAPGSPGPKYQLLIISIFLCLLFQGIFLTEDLTGTQDLTSSLSISEANTISDSNSILDVQKQPQLQPDLIEEPQPEETLLSIEQVSKVHFRAL